MIQQILSLSDDVRYVAIYRDGQLQTRAREGTANTSSSESDRYEELIVNPTLLKLTGQRGDIDCGGLAHVIIRYGHFFQIVMPAPWGHVSVCVEQRGDPVTLAEQVASVVTATR